MTEQSTVLMNCTCNNKLVKCIDDLWKKRDALQKDITFAEKEKSKLHNDIQILTDKLQNDIQILSERFVKLVSCIL